MLFRKPSSSTSRKSFVPKPATFSGSVSSSFSLLLGFFRLDFSVAFAYSNFWGFSDTMHVVIQFSCDVNDRLNPLSCFKINLNFDT